jgi:hypothetical protein
MCLYINKKARVQTAKKDITVYKTVDTHKECAVSVYQGFRYKFKRTYTCELERTTKRVPRPQKVYSVNRITCETHYVVEKGFHSFKSKIDAASFTSGTHVVSCIIPKGAQYIVGKWKGLNNYASNKIKIMYRIDRSRIK